MQFWEEQRRRNAFGMKQALRRTPQCVTYYNVAERLYEDEHEPNDEKEE